VKYLHFALHHRAMPENRTGTKWALVIWWEQRRRTTGSQFRVWKNIGLGAAFVVVIAAPEALHVVSAAPQSRADTAPAKPVADNSFVPTCKATEIVDSRPDPAWVGESFAHDNCWAPRLPAPMDGYAATREQIVAGMTAVKNYAASADVYQRCISDFITVRRTQAEKSKKSLDETLILIENHRITASQENKKKATRQVEVAINAFNEYGSECVD
jgi:hypothetical protein